MGLSSNGGLYPFPIFTGDGFLTEVESRQISNLFDGIFPRDVAHGIPSASDADAHIFLSKLLAFDDNVQQDISTWRDLYRESLESLNTAVSKAHSSTIQDLTSEQITHLLVELEKGTFEGLPKTFPQKRFFRLLLKHCIQGCFADPRWGGNRNRLMWKWLGWSEPPTDITRGHN